MHRRQKRLLPQETTTEVADDDSKTIDSAQAATDAKEESPESSSVEGDEKTKASDKLEAATQADAGTKADKLTEEDDSIGPLLTDTPKLKKRAKPLREVADAIKKQLVAADTQKAIQEVMVEASSQVSNFRGAYMNWKVSKEGGSDDVEPEFDVKGIAESLNLIANETPLVDDEGLEQEQLGKVMTLINVAARGGQYRPQAVTVANLIFNKFEELDEYEVQDVQDFQSQSQYVFWLSEKRGANDSLV